MTEQDLERQLAAARRDGPMWNAGRQQQLKWALMKRIEGIPHRRGLPLGLVVGCTTLAIVAVGAAVGWQRLMRLETAAPSSTSSASSASSEFGVAKTAAPASSEWRLPQLSDGSIVVLDGPAAVLTKTVDKKDELAFQLETGGAHFDVTLRPSRIFRVHAGAVTVQVIGTRFHVEREKIGARIAVDRGRVLVSWWGGSRELGAGEAGTFPPETARPDNKRAVPTHARPARRSALSLAPTPSARRADAPKRTPAADRRSEEQGSAAPAAAVVAPTPAPPPISTLTPTPTLVGPDALFARADSARVSGRPELAVVHLREILDRHSDDPHAAMAAFTLGRLLLESLGKPHEAASAFGRARSLAPRGPLVEDALAREVEALHAANDAASARERATLYRKLFPNGPRLRAVMRFGGLQSTP